MTKAMTLPTYSTTAEQVESVEKDGFAYFPGFLDPQEVAGLKAAMDATPTVPAHFDRDPSQTVVEQGFYEKVINNAFNHNELFFAFLDKPGIIEVAEALHGEDCHVIGMTAWVTGPGRPPQNLHVDYLAVEMPAHVMADPQVRMPVFITTAHFYLNDLYPELGPTQFIPGSHRSGTRPQPGQMDWNGRQIEDCIVQAGDAVIFRSEVWHRGTPNTSDETRYLLQVHYAQRMITQKFPPYLNRFLFNPELLAQATPRQRRLLGDHRKGNYD